MNFTTKQEKTTKPTQASFLLTKASLLKAVKSITSDATFRLLAMVLSHSTLSTSSIVLLAQGMMARSVVLNLGAEEFMAWVIVLSVFMDKTMASAKAIQPDGFTETDLVWENGNFVIPSL